MQFGQLPFDVAHGLAGGMLLVSFVLLYQRRVSALIGALATQGALLGMAALWQGWVQGATGLYLTGLIAIVAKAVLIPWALSKLVDRLSLHRTVQTALGIGPSMIAGVALVALALVVALPVSAGGSVLAREDLAVALSIVLLGMLVMIARRNAIGQVIGLMSLENGLILAAVGVQGLPLVVELSTAALVLVIALVAGVFLTGIRERFDSLDIAFLEDHRGERR
ncbi:hydrogenase-4 component E [Humitalea sp. 24SJ18S-53]|uniref:hydrogenase-4 component E n=1 Tax=Humitalea sp. 24SJ18S-53 TaxID=3422307 RepID=UPI003D668E96